MLTTVPLSSTPTSPVTFLKPPGCSCFKTLEPTNSTFIPSFIGNVIEPRVMGEGLELHPVVILIALVFWGLLWGPMGAILAVPITAVIRIVTARFISLKMVSDVMAGRLPT